MKAKKATLPKTKQEELPFFTVGEIKAVYLPATRPTQQVKCSQDVYKIFLEIWESDQLEYRESLYAMFLNKANFVIGWRQLTNGGVSGTVADPKILFQHALLSHASAILLAHNHPSGNLKPSEADRQMTKKMVEAGKIHDLLVLDHLVISREGFYSFADEGQL